VDKNPGSTTRPQELVKRWLTLTSGFPKCQSQNAFRQVTKVGGQHATKTTFGHGLQFTGFSPHIHGFHPTSIGEHHGSKHIFLTAAATQRLASAHASIGLPCRNQEPTQKPLPKTWPSVH
jgi:hypothetical protein